MFSRLVRPFLILAAIFIAFPSGAVSYTWLGTGSNWSAAANWTPAGIPGAGDIAIITTATANEPQLTGNISIIGLTVTSHTINLNGFSLNVNSAASVNLTNATIGQFAFGGGTVDITAPTFSFSNVIFDATLTVSKSGAGTATSTGCTYNGTTVFTNNSNQPLRLGAVALPDIFNADVTLNNSNTGFINAAYNSAGNLFNRNIWLNSTVGGGIDFGVAGGTSTLANGFLIAEGATGFNMGTLEIRNFTQAGTTAQALNLSWGGPLSASALVMRVGPGTTFNGSVNFTASNLHLNGCTYNGAATQLTKVVNGGSLNICNGGNIFNSALTTITNGTGISEWRFAVTTADTYNGDVVFTRSTSGGILTPAYNGLNVFRGNVTVNSSYVVGPGTPVLFGAGTGTAQFDGTLAQSINKPNAIMAAPVFTRLIMAKASTDLTLNSPVTISANLTLSNGRIFSSALNIPVLSAGATTNIGNANSYVNGPIQCLIAAAGNSFITFPIGKNGEWRPAELNTSHSDAVSVAYTGEVIASSAAALGYTLPVSIANVSTVRYWQIDRQAVANFNSATVTLYYGPDDGVTNFPFLTVAKTIGAGTVWNNIGGTATANGTGSITSGAFTSFSKFVLANNSGGNNPLPVELISFRARADGSKVNLYWETVSETDNDFFTVERSDGNSPFVEILRLDGAGNSTEYLQYETADCNPPEGILYYRLKQTDFNGQFSYSEIVPVHLEKDEEFKLEIYPNPVNGNAFSLAIKRGTGENKFSFFITDISGQILFLQEVISDDPLVSIAPENSREWVPGVYFITVQTETKTQTKQLIIQ